MLSACNISSRVVCRSWNHTSRRWKSKKEHWAKKRNKITSSMKALEHFDDFYKKVFGNQWPSIRVSLLSPNKYCAVVNNFGDVPETISHFQNQGASDLRNLMNINKQQPFSEDEENYKGNSNNSLDYKIQQFISDTQTKELRETYPVEKERPFLQECESVDNKQEKSSPLTSSGHSESLEVSLEKAEIAMDRIVDPSVGLSASTLFEFVPATKLKGLDQDYVVESDHYRYYCGDTEFPVSTKIETSLDYPEYLNVFVYERGNVTTFQPPQKGSTGVLNYYLMDGGSVLPVIALGIKSGDNVLDMCAAPGGKSLLMLQTLLPASLVCNDVQESRVKRIHSVMKQYIYDLPKWEGSLVVTQDDGRAMEGKYDKILVDVPCTNDRHSLHEDDNNIFSVTRMKERLRLPELQAQLLKNALKLLVPGGAVVYSTCSLSPIQNDGVVHMALRHIWEETNIGVEVRDLSPALEATKGIFHLGNNVGLRYGHLVLPFLPTNFGPLYFCKLVRTK